MKVISIFGAALLAAEGAQPLFGTVLPLELLLAIAIAGAVVQVGVQMTVEPPRALRRAIGSIIVSVTIGGAVAGLIAFYGKLPPVVTLLSSVILISLGYEKVLEVVQPIGVFLVERFLGIKVKKAGDDS